jgi:arsenate reductase-like glutaredoxin family protein
MELRINIDYNQILKLIQQLPKKEIKRLASSLQSELLIPKSSDTLKELILKAPTWTDSDHHDYNEARTHLNQSRIA